MLHLQRSRHRFDRLRHSADASTVDWILVGVPPGSDRRNPSIVNGFPSRAVKHITGRLASLMHWKCTKCNRDSAALSYVDLLNTHSFCYWISVRVQGSKANAHVGWAELTTTRPNRVRSFGIALALTRSGETWTRDVKFGNAKAVALFFGAAESDAFFKERGHTQTKESLSRYC